jgi:hypothetical protein
MFIRRKMKRFLGGKREKPPHLVKKVIRRRTKRFLGGKREKPPLLRITSGKERKTPRKGM